MGLKRIPRWAAWVLSGFVLRSLIPVGFMPMAGPGHSLRLVVCDGYAPVPSAAVPMPMDVRSGLPMDMPDGVPMEHPGGGHPAHHGDCPYGSSPALGALPTLAIVPTAVQRLVEPPMMASPQVEYFEVSPRAQSPRGPPA